MKLVTRIAYDQLSNSDEIPIVAILMNEVGDCYIEKNIGLKHAEMTLLDKYSCRNGIIFVNVEPCPMCLFALSLAKVKYVFFGCFNKQYGACGGKFKMKDQIDYPVCQHIGGFYIKENEFIIKEFFQKKRKLKTIG
jgi:tRNA(adenine34) deaminase